jgi:hypothetical protein
VATKQQQDEQEQYSIVSLDEDDGQLPVPYGLRLRSATNAAQRLTQEETENREVALVCHIGLARQAQVGVGQAARVAGAQFHRTVGQHSRLVAASKGLPFAPCEVEFDRMNLEQQMQNHFAVSDGLAQNLRGLVVEPLYKPNPKKRGFSLFKWEG